MQTKAPGTICAPPEKLTEGNLFLRRWQPSDIEALNTAVAASANELAPWMEWWPAEGYCLTTAQQFLELTATNWNAGNAFDYAVIVDGRVSGSFGLKCPVSKAPDTLEIGYWLATDVTGRGLGTRAAALLTKMAFEIGAESVQIRHGQGKNRSAAIPRRLGFTRIGVCVLGTGNEECVLWQINCTVN